MANVTMNRSLPHFARATADAMLAVMRFIFSNACPCVEVGLLCLSAWFVLPFTGFAQPSAARQPFGIYARFDPGGCVNFPGPGSDADDCLSNSVASLLSNPAISGIAVF